MKFVPCILQANMSGLLYGLLLAIIVKAQKVFKLKSTTILSVKYEDSAEDQTKQ